MNNPFLTVLALLALWALPTLVAILYPHKIQPKTQTWIWRMNMIILFPLLTIFITLTWLRHREYGWWQIVKELWRSL